MIQNKLTISNQEVGQRLDKFLINYFQRQATVVSRSFLQKAIRGGEIIVNQKMAKPSYKLKISDQLEIVLTLPSTELALLPNKEVKLSIIYENTCVLVIDKPAGLNVHPGLKQENNTLANGLLYYYPAIQGVGDDPSRPGIIHRLDKDTSGLMIVAKDNETFNFLKEQFKNRLVIKKYLALVNGYPKKETDIIEASIEKSKRDPTKQKISSGIKAKEAITAYTVVKKFAEGFSLIEATPKTGRMHQIRLHLSYIGHPIVGDQKYGGPVLGTLKRQFLHATYLSLTIPMDGQPRLMEFKSDLPDDLKKIIADLSSLDDSAKKIYT